jgi:hypothetical protein
MGHIGSDWVIYRLGQIRSGLVKLGHVRSKLVTLGQIGSYTYGVRLGQVWSSWVM